MGDDAALPPPSNGVEEEACLVKALVCFQRPRREPRSTQEAVHEVPVQLVKAFENIVRATSERHTSELSNFQFQGSEEPGILCTNRSRSASKKIVTLPRLNPGSQMP
jgi:hypothetical protein